MATTEQPKVPAEAEQASPAGEVVGEPIQGALKRMVDPRAWLESTGGRAVPLLVALVVMWIAFDVATGGIYFGAQNITSILIYTALYGIVAIGVTIILLLGEIDLSLGSLVGLTGCTAALVMIEWAPNASDFQRMLVGVAASLVTGLLCGFFQGFWVAVMKIPSFVVTLAGLLAFSGIALVITASNTVVISTDYFNAWGSTSTSAFNRGFLPTLVGDHTKFFGHISAGMMAALIGGLGYTLVLLANARTRRRIGLPARNTSLLLVQGLGVAFLGIVLADVVDNYEGVPLSVFVFLVLLVVFAYVLRRTRWGRHVYATGGNPEASRRAGIPVQGVRWSAFVLSGLMAGVVGVIFMAQGASASAGSVDPSFLLLCIAAAVIGGTSLFGGRGSVWGALIGALIISSLQFGMDLTLVSTNSQYYQYIVEGAILLLAVWLDTYGKNRSSVDHAG